MWIDSGLIFVAFERLPVYEVGGSCFLWTFLTPK